MLKTLFLFISGVIFSVDSTITDCGVGKSVFTIESQGFYPEPPVANEKYDYWFYYTVPNGVTVSSGTAKYSFSLNGIPFSPTTEDLCTQTFCPKTAGSYNESSTDTWPSGISGKIVTKLEWFDANGNLLVCSQTTEKV